MKPSMLLKEAKEWIRSVWVVKAAANVPVHRGLACNECHHCTSNMKFMRKHFSNNHRGLKASENSQECTVQMPFRAELRKYIQVDEFDNEMMREDNDDDGEEWNKALEEEFDETIGRISISGTNEHERSPIDGRFYSKNQMGSRCERHGWKDAH